MNSYKSTTNGEYDAYFDNDALAFSTVCFFLGPRRIYAQAHSLSQTFVRNLPTRQNHITLWGKMQGFRIFNLRLRQDICKETTWRIILRLMWCWWACSVHGFANLFNVQAFWSEMLDQISSLQVQFFRTWLTIHILIEWINLGLTSQTKLTNFRSMQHRFKLMW